MAGIEKLTDRAVNAQKPPEKGKLRISDGGGLYFVTRATGSKSWVYMWKRGGKPTEIGLGSYPALSLSNARSMARVARSETTAGRDPRNALSPSDVKLFEEVARAVVEARSTGRSGKTRYQWERDLIQRCKSLHRRPINAVTRDEILKLMRPVWVNTPESGRRFRHRLEAVFAYAIAMRWREGDNPAALANGLAHVLPPHIDSKSHHNAMPWEDVPVFMSRLSERPAISARALAFTILTASRTSEAILAKWDEFDLSQNTWTVPEERMKGQNGLRKAHDVPLSTQARAIIEGMASAKTSDFVFPGHKLEMPLSNMAMLTLLKKRMGEPFTVHGFRSSFRDWAGEATEYPRELSELSLAHAVGSASERAYRRGKAVERRRALMEAWGEFCRPSAKIPDNVLRLHG